jgi:hypothetical protein
MIAVPTGYMTSRQENCTHYELIWRNKIMSKKEVSASQAGTVTLDNEIFVHRLGYDCC